jgi:hypothetical protein
MNKRLKFRDHGMTFDAARNFNTYDGRGNQMGVPFGQGYRTHDGRTVDSTGALLVGELERLDLTLHEPLVNITWGRDVPLREDVTIADEVSSFTLSTYGSAGGLGTGNSIGNGKSWIGKETTQISGTQVDLAKVPHTLHLWGNELKYTIPELEMAAKLGRPIDQQKFDGLKMKHQMDIDEMVYIGDSSLGAYGLVNQPGVTYTNAPNGAAASPLWSKKTADEILADVNSLLASVWATSAYAVVPDTILLPPFQFSILTTAKVSSAGNISILRYVMENNLLTTSTGKKLKIYPVKWLVGAGNGGTIGTTGTVDRMMAYSKNKNHVRYPMTLLQRTPIQYDSLWHKTTYFCRLGEIEYVYPATAGYLDGI